MSRASIDDIATEAGVSRATVARILSGQTHYTRPACARRAEKIRRMAAKMGYRPNAAAKAISTGRFRHIGLLMGVHYERSNFTREMLRGIHDVLQQRRMHLSIWFMSDEQLANQAALPLFLREQMVDGLLLNYTHAIPQHVQQAILHAGLPVVWVNVKRDDASVYPDDYSAARRAVSFLRELGHRRIAFADFLHGAGNDFQPHYSALDRRDGYEAAMRDAALTATLIEVPRMLSGPDAVARAAQALRGGQRPTAIVCQSPRDASIFEVAAARLGLEIPGELSLITFGSDRQVGSVTDPTLLVEPREALGRAAVEALLARLDRPAEPIAARRLDYELKLGQTTARAPDE